MALIASATVTTTPAALMQFNMVGVAFLNAFPALCTKAGFAFTFVSSLNVIENVVLPADLAELILQRLAHFENDWNLGRLRRLNGMA